MSVSSRRVVIPKNWSQYGEIYMDSYGNCVLVCTDCMEATGCFELGFKTFDISSFWTHIKSIHVTETAQQSGNESLTKNEGIVKSDLCGDFSQSQYQPKVDNNVDKCRKEDEISFQKIGEIVECVLTPEATSDDFGFNLMEKPTLTIELSSDEEETVPDGCNLMSIEENTSWLKSAFISICPTCQEAFTTTEQFYAHLRGQRHYLSKMCPFQCKACGKHTASEQAMNNHQLRFHSSESATGTVTCRICFKVVSLYHLKQHLAAHSTTPRNFQCKLCSRSYRHIVNLSAHIQKVHPWAPMDQQFHAELTTKSQVAAKNVTSLWFH